jgi:hypothetical protein
LFLCPSPPSVRYQHPLPPTGSIGGVEIRSKRRLIDGRNANFQAWRANETTPLRYNQRI